MCQKIKDALSTKHSSSVRCPSITATCPKPPSNTGVVSLKISGQHAGPEIIHHAIVIYMYDIWFLGGLCVTRLLNDDFRLSVRQ